MSLGAAVVELKDKTSPGEQKELTPESNAQTQEIMIRTQRNVLAAWSLDILE